MTQGLLTIIDDYEIKYKIVIGHDGGQMFQLAMEIIEMDAKEISSETLYDMALELLESKESLVVASENSILYKGNDDVPCNKDSLYRTTFGNAHFNPRWKYGTAPYILILDLTNNILKW